MSKTQPKSKLKSHLCSDKRYSDINLPNLKKTFLFPPQLLGLVALLLAVGVVVPLGELVAPVLQRLPVIDWLIK